jgi:tRNA threonylcarbamoyladenosine biosynthesis protein TsaB
VRILALETATPLASCAVVDPSGVLAEATLRAPMRQLEWLVPAVQEMLRNLGIGPEAIEAVAVSRGPGGFTGLRIGIATAVAWARARNVPVLGVGTLEALAAVPGRDGLVLPALDAHRGEVAGALYRATSSGALACLVSPLVASPAVLAAEVASVLGPREARESGVLLLGDGAARYGAALREALGPGAEVGGPHLHPRAAAVGLLALPRLRAGERDDPLRVLPIYGRRPAVTPWQETPRRTGIREERW